jgi:hypothetical protein
LKDIYMARFPIPEAQIINLATKLASGLKNNTDMFPNTPVSPEILETTVSEMFQCRHNVDQALAGYKQALREKDEKLVQLIAMMKKDIRYAEDAVDFNDEKLKTLGWSARRRRGKMPPPGQVAELEVGYNAGGVAILKWKKPDNGGKILAYEVLRDINASGWQVIGSSVFEEIMLTDQPAGKKMEYKVRAVNKTGKGLESNTVEVVT